MRLAAVVLMAVVEAISVRAQQKNVGKNVRYSYDITNPSSKTIVTLLIGVDLNKPVPQLDAEPIGWNPLRSERIGYGLRIPSSAAASPGGWIPIAMLFEERDRMAIGWIVADDNSPGIGSGATATGFEITVDKLDSEYTSGPFTAIFDDGTISSGRINRR